MARLVVPFLLFSLTYGQYQPHCAPGRDGKVMVHLFEWRWTEVADECERFLGPKGFCGVQVSPPNEHRIVTNPNRPWWERYQPVSYKLESRSGTRQQFIDMVNRCNAAGVRIYIDAVINHMVGADGGSGQGSGGSNFNTQTLSFDGVPYGPNDFGKSCTTASGNIENYNDVNQVRNCRLVALTDLNGGSSYVRGKIAGYLNDMLTIGIDGYRIDAAKHMWPGDIQATLALTRDTIFGGRPFVYQEVIDLYGSEPIKAEHYTAFGKVTEFKYGLKLGEAFKSGQTKLSNLRTFGPSWGMLSDMNAYVFVDNHDNQRGHGGGGNVITHKDSRNYKMATVFMLSWPYGVPNVMSSYTFTQDWTGPPSGTQGFNAICQNGWICEHRWRQIQNMVAWRNAAGSSAVENWWTNGNNQIAYSRGNKAFIAFNRGDGVLSQTLRTGLPAGVYCDVISGESLNGKCTGKTVTVNADGSALIQIDGSSEDPMIAIHVGNTGAGGGSGGGAVQPQVPAPTGTKRTIVFISKSTIVGQDLFLRGGCGAACAIPISYTSHSGVRFFAYNDWRVGDRSLDWNGAEAGQGTSGGRAAQGSPMAWTTNKAGFAGYVPENVYGEHYWMWDVNMDCSKTNQGWFELKGYLDGLWESNVAQGACTGNAGGVAPVQSGNHWARCGSVNVFTWNSNGCIINNI